MVDDTDAMAIFKQSVAEATDGLAPKHQRTKQAIARKKRADAVRSFLDKNEKWTPTRVTKVAQNLGRILDDFCGEGGPTRTDVVRKAGMLDASGKPKVLDRYTLPLSSNPGRRRRLVRNPRNYLKLARAAAELSQRDLDDTILKLVDGLNLGIGEQPADDEKPDFLHLISSALRTEANRIIRGNRLDYYFRTLEQRGVSPSFDGWQADGGGSLWLHFAMPQVQLMTEPGLAPLLTGTWTPASGGLKKTVGVQVCNRTALCLAPLGPGDEVRPYFATRPVLYASWREACAGMPFYNAYTERTGLPSHSGLARTRRGTLQLNGDEMTRLLEHLVLPDAPGEEWTFVEICDAIIDEIFGQDGAVEWEPEDALSNPADSLTLSPSDTRLAKLERALLVGGDQTHADSRLMKLLDDDARARTESLEAWINSECAKVEAALLDMAAGDVP